MAVELNTGLPSFRFVQGFIRDQAEVEILLMNNERLTGKLFWQDPECICIKDANGVQTACWRHAITYIRARA